MSGTFKLVCLFYMFVPIEPVFPFDLIGSFDMVWPF